jgi:xanthine dehydrogenase iron-sulfur cluster and FAD-binding subunit A
LSKETLHKAIPLIREAISPIDDIRATASYRRIVAGHLLLRLLTLSP